MAKIATILGRPGDVTYWQNLLASTTQTVEAALFPDGPSGQANEHYFPNDPTCTLTGIRPNCKDLPGLTVAMLNSPDLGAPYVQNLVNEFITNYDPAGVGQVLQPADAKGEDVDYLALGLIRHGQGQLLPVVLNDWIADAVNVPIYSEWYAGASPQGNGNDPMGAFGIVAFVLQNNGYMFDDGLPSFYNLQGTNGAVNNIPWRGKTFSAVLNASTGTETLTGSAVANNHACTKIHIGTTLYQLPQTCLTGSR